MAFFSINFFLNLHFLFCMLTFGFYAMSHFKNLYQSIFLIINFFIIYFRTLISYFNHLLHFLSTKHFNTPSPLPTQNTTLQCYFELFNIWGPNQFLNIKFQDQTFNLACQTSPKVDLPNYQTNKISSRQQIVKLVIEVSNWLVNTKSQNQSFKLISQKFPKVFH